MERVLVLFDVDGTLTKSRLDIENEAHATLKRLKQKVTVGLVGGSDINKITGQMDILRMPTAAKERVISDYDFVFSENGLVAYEKGELINSASILEQLGEDACQEIINFALQYISKLKIPKKRGTFVEFRTGMINISPVGRSCSLEERLEFFEFDKAHKVREQFAKALTDEFGPKYQMQFALGGQISIDAFPIGWDKTYCLKFVKDRFDKIYFFGDKTDKGGNDHELYVHEIVKGYKVENPEHTVSLLNEIFNLK